MRKFIVALVACAALALPAAASADVVSTPAGDLGVNEPGYAVYADGAATNPGPSSGFVSVSSGGQVCGDDNGSPGNSTSPTCSP